MFGQPTESHIAQLSQCSLPVPPIGTQAENLLEYYKNLKPGPQLLLSRCGEVLRTCGGYIMTEYTRNCGRGPYKFSRLEPISFGDPGWTVVRNGFTYSNYMRTYHLDRILPIYCIFKINENEERRCFLRQVTPLLRQITISRWELMGYIFQHTGAFNLIAYPSRASIIAQSNRAYRSQNSDSDLSISVSEMKVYARDIAGVIRDIASYFGNGMIIQTIEQDPEWQYEETLSLMEKLFWAIPNPKS